MATGRPENLKPFSARTEEEQRAIRVKGGQASGIARRRKRNMREILKMLKDMPVKDRQIVAQLQAAGMTDKDMTFGAAMAFSAIIHAMKGNGPMMRLIFDMLGETPDVRIKEQELKVKKGTLTALNKHIDRNPFTDLTTDELRKLIDSG
mgnify:FL=1